MTTDDFRRIALSLDGAEESSHMGQADFRVGGRIFATLAAAAQGYGNLMLTPEQQATFVEELPEVFIPIPGGWGKNGATHIRLAAANKDVLEGALRTAWKLRLENNRRSGNKKKLGSLRQWLLQAGLWKARRARVERVHVWRKRRARWDELVQWGTSMRDWLEGRRRKLYLIALLDDATSRRKRAG
jgi:hypothetical protein